MTDNIPTLRIWWIPDVPGEPFMTNIGTLDEAKSLLNALVDYTRYLERRAFFPEYSADVGGIEVYDEGEWVDAELIYDDEGMWDYVPVVGVSE